MKRVIFFFFYNEFRGFGYEIISGGGQWDISIYTYMIDPGGLFDTPPHGGEGAFSQLLKKPGFMSNY